MHTSFMEYLVDPISGNPLNLEVYIRRGDFVIEGSLVGDHGSYPIIRGIPRFAGYGEIHAGSYAKSFSFQWLKWSRIQFESENEGKPMQGHTQAMWERIVAIAPNDMRDSIVADFGCGSGRFIEVVRMKGGRVIGLDISNAVEAAQNNFRDDSGVLICQADVLNSPIRPESMDGAFSIGVLHHTPDPRQGFAQIVKTVKRGGWIAVSVYGKGSYYDFPTVRLYRRIFGALWHVLGPYPALLYSYLAAYVLRPFSNFPLIGLLIRALFPIARLPDPRWSLLDTFDSVTPRFQSAHETYEVFTWFRDCHMRDIEPSSWGSTAFHGIRA